MIRHLYSLIAFKTGVDLRKLVRFAVVDRLDDNEFL